MARESRIARKLRERIQENEAAYADKQAQVTQLQAEANMLRATIQADEALLADDQATPKKKTPEV